MLTDGLGGSITISVMVGFTKNPVQLAARANVASAMHAPITRSFEFFENIRINTPGPRRRRFESCFAACGFRKIVAEMRSLRAAL